MSKFDDGVAGHVQHLLRHSDGDLALKNEVPDVGAPMRGWKGEKGVLLGNRCPDLFGPNPDFSGIRRVGQKEGYVKANAYVGKAGTIAQTDPDYTSEPLHIFDPRRSLQLLGFTGRATSIRRRNSSPRC
jgi:hypothetical protein